MSARRALVTGAAGQDGSYLVELLRDHGYEVVGVVRDSAAAGGPVAADELVAVDLTDAPAVHALLARVRPAEVYNLAAPTVVTGSWGDPAGTVGAIAMGAAALFASALDVDPGMRVFQASSSEVFAGGTEPLAAESTQRRPVNPYGVAKACADSLAAVYRARGLHVSCGILFNHESPRRSEAFLPSKVAHAAARISLGLETTVSLGDLAARRDWGYAPDYVAAMWRMLQQPEPGDYVVATGELHSVEDLVELAFARVGLDWHDHVRVDAALERGQRGGFAGDAAKARRELGWAPSLTFDELVALLVDEALAGLQTSS